MGNWDQPWTFIIFLTAIGLIVLHTLWTERRIRNQRQLARDEYTQAMLQKQKQAYAESQAQLEALFNSMTEGVLLLDQSGRVQLYNDSLRRLFQVTGDIRGKSVVEAFRLHDLDVMSHRLLKECTALSLDFELPGTTPRFLHVNASAVLDPNARQSGAILVFHDQTRVRQLENTRQEFVANVSHELRTPLALIKGFVETLLDGAKDDPKVASRFLQTINKHTDRLTFLIEDLLTISKLESGQVSMNMQPTSLKDLAAKVIDDLHARAQDKNVRLVNEIPEDLFARCDGDRMLQVFFNLIDNAIKYGRNDGRVSVMGIAPNGGTAQVAVQDDGPGIPPEARERVFERFFRIDKARSREQGGTGLGLAIVKHIVQCHGGKVWVESEPGKGATFFFTLPLQTDKGRK